MAAQGNTLSTMRHHAPSGPQTTGTPRERRDTTPQGVARRARFEQSLEVLRGLGLSPYAIEHYRQLARKSRTLPDELVRNIAEDAAQSDILGIVSIHSGRPA